MSGLIKIEELVQDDQALLGHLRTRKSTLKENNRTKHEMMRKCYEYYRASGDYLKAKMRDKKGMPNLVTARPFQQVEVLKSFMLGNRPKIYAEMERQNEQVTNEALEFVNTIFWGKDEINFEEVMDSAEAWRLIGGTAIKKVSWVKRFGERQVPVTVFNMPTPFTRTERHLVKNTPNVYAVNPLRWFGDPYTENMRDQKEVCEELPMNLSVIREAGQALDLDGKPIFSHTEQIDTNMIEEMEKNETVVEWMDVTGNDGYKEPGIESHDPRINVEQWWLSPNWCVTVIPDKLVLQKRKHKYGMPYVKECFIKDSGLFWGIGIIEPLIPAYDEKNEYRNLRLAVKKRFYGNLITYNPKELHDETDLEPKPAQTIRVKRRPTDAIMITSPPAGNHSMIEEEAVIDRDLELEGVSSYVSGQGAEEPTETASGIYQLQTAAANKFEKPRGRLEHGVEETVEMVCKFLSIHLVDAKQYYVNRDGYLSKRYIDYSWFENPKGEALFRMKVELGSTKPINEQTEMKKWLMFYKMSANDPFWNQIWLRLFTAEKLNIKNAQDGINQVPMIPMQQAQQMAQEAFKKGEQSRVKEEVNAKLLAEEKQRLGDEDAKLEQEAESLKGKMRKGENRGRGEDGRRGAS